MSDFKRIYLPGHYYFFTLVTQDRRPWFNSAQNVQLLRDAFAYVMERRPFTLFAAVVLPDHIHCIWQMPNDDADYSVRWQMIKTAFSRKMTEKDIWQPRFWEHVIRDHCDLCNHLDYIHYNPVKHALSDSPAQWPYSSFLRFVGKEWYAADWGHKCPASIRKMELE